MNIFETLILNVILIGFPVVMLLYYFAYNKNIKKEEKDLFFDISLVSSFYLTIRFGMPTIGHKLLLITNIPLLIAYYKNKTTSIILLSALIVYYNYNNFNINLIYLILEYGIYFLINHYFVKRLKKESYNLIFVLKIISFIIWAIVDNYFDDYNLILSIGIMVVNYSLIFYSFIFLFKKAEDILKYHMSMKELEQEKQIRLTLFRIIHEIKNPIAVCKGYLDMFDTNNIDCSRKYIPILRDEVARILLLLQDFLNLNKIKIEKEIVDINMVLEDVTDNFKEMFKEKSIKYEFNIPDEGIYILGDYNRLTQVFINIIKNAEEAIQDQNKRFIKIDSIKNETLVCIKISDNGPGISADVLEKINEPFFTTKVTGTGLGVSLSYEIVKAHNGTIEYITEETKGTIVEIKIPLIQP